jgi:hypothetical protein
MFLVVGVEGLCDASAAGADRHSEISPAPPASVDQELSGAVPWVAATADL